MSIVVLLIGAFAHQQWSHYQEELARAKQDLESRAILLAEHAAQAFETVETTLQSVAHLQVDAIDAPLNPDEANRLLRALQDGSGILRSVGWIDGEGNRIASSLFKDPPPLNVSGEESYQYWQNADPSRSGTLFIASPIRSKILDDWIILVSTGLSGADGEFHGFAGGVVYPSFFARLYREVEIGSGRVVTMFRGDGTIMAREPVDDSLLGTSLAGRPFMTDIVVDRDVGTFEAFGLSDGKARIIGFARSSSHDLIITVAIPTAVALADFWSAMTQTIVRLAITVILILVGTVFLVREMRRREAAERLTQAREVRFRELASLSGDWFWETDEEHRFVWMSDSVETAIGVPAAWHYGRTRVDLAAPDGAPSAVWQDHYQVLAAHLPFHDFEYTRRGPDGDRWFRTSGVPIFDESGAFKGYRGAARDISDLKSAQQRLWDAVEALPGGFSLFGPDGRLEYVNATETSMLPEIAEMGRIGDTFEEILWRMVDAGTIEEAAEDPEGWIADRLRRHREANGSMLIEFPDRTVEVIERRTNDGSTIVLRFDVTDRERARHVEKELRRAADSANRAKSDFLLAMSHELRAPLNAVMGFSELLEANGSTHPETARKYVGYIRSAGSHLLSLIDEVLDLSAIEAGRLNISLQGVSLPEAVESAFNTVRPAATKSGIALVTEVDSDTARAVQADPVRLKQVLLNLLTNAIKYSFPDTTVTVRFGRSDGNHIRIEVADQGPGIPPAKQHLVFQPFERLGAEQTLVEGTGIGLALTRKIVEAMQGSMGFKTREGEGTTFWVELLAAEVATERVPQAQGKNFSALPPCRVLHIDDDELNRLLVQSILASSSKADILMAETGVAGIALARQVRPDVVLLDLQLPDLDGFEVLRRLRQDGATRDIPVIALTANASETDIKNGLDAGFDRYLTKPVEVDKLRDALSGALRDRGTRAAPARKAG